MQKSSTARTGPESALLNAPQLRMRTSRLPGKRFEVSEVCVPAPTSSEHSPEEELLVLYSVFLGDFIRQFPAAFLAPCLHFEGVEPKAGLERDLR